MSINGDLALRPQPQCSQIEIIRETRCRAAVFADRIGHVPLVGNVSGLCRMTVSAVLGIFCAIACAFVYLSNRSGYEESIWNYRFNRCSDEYERGFSELIPIANFLLYKRYDVATCEAEIDAPAARITGRAYGSFVYRRGSEVYYSFGEHTEVSKVAAGF